MARSRVETHSGSASVKSILLAIVLAALVGWWIDWAGPWWAYLVGAIAVYLGAMGGWVQSTQQNEQTQAMLEMNERQRREEEKGE